MLQSSAVDPKSPAKSTPTSETEERTLDESIDLQRINLVPTTSPTENLFPVEFALFGVQRVCLEHGGEHVLCKDT